MKAERILFLDTETGGLDSEKHDLLTIGLVVWENMQILDELELKISRESYRAEESALKVNGINLKQLEKEGINEKEVINQLLYFVKKNFGENKNFVVAGHNINFDKDFLKKFLKDNYINWSNHFGYRTIDTMTLLLFVYLQGKTEGRRLGKLDDAIQHFNLDPEERHTALCDARVTARLFEKLLMLNV